RPDEPIVETGEHKAAAPEWSKEFAEDPLRVLFFLGFEPALEQVAVMTVEINRHEEAGRHQFPDEDPSFPEPQGARGNKQDGDSYRHAEGEPDGKPGSERHLVCIGHSCR